MTPEQLHARATVRFRDGRTRTWPSVAERLAAHLNPAGPDSCWEFGGTRNPKGYGQLQGLGRLELAHRIAYVLAHGPIPDGLMVLHRCDNPPCCNGSHLYAGSAAQNTADCLSRGRHHAPHSLGNGKAKLADADVTAIRSAHATGESCKGIARRLGLHPSYVGRLVRGVRRPVLLDDGTRIHSTDIPHEEIR